MTSRINNSGDKAQRKLDQLSALLLMVSETNHDVFCLMGESSQQSLLSLAYDLSIEVERLSRPAA